MFSHLAGALSLICIWSTTALAIKWSVSGLDYSAALFLRFAIAFVLMMGWIVIRRPWPKLDRQTRTACLIAGGSTIFSMACTYWASQYLNSGLVAVLYGLNPLITILLVAILHRQSIDWLEITGIMLAIGGLISIFSDQVKLNLEGLPALLAVLLAVFINSLSIIKLKDYSQGLDNYVISTGSMGLCALGGAAIWLSRGFPLPEVWPVRALGAIFYLALVASVFALSVYFWMIRERPPTQVAIIPMISTTASLWLGHFLNQEILTGHILLGSALIIGGLFLHQFKSLRAR